MQRKSRKDEQPDERKGTKRVRFSDEDEIEQTKERYESGDIRAEGGEIKKTEEKEEEEMESEEAEKEEEKMEVDEYYEEKKYKNVQQEKEKEQKENGRGGEEEAKEKEDKQNEEEEEEEEEEGQGGGGGRDEYDDEQKEEEEENDEVEDEPHEFKETQENRKKVEENGEGNGYKIINTNYFQFNIKYISQKIQLIFHSGIDWDERETKQKFNFSASGLNVSVDEMGDMSIAFCFKVMFIEVNLIIYYRYVMMRSDLSGMCSSASANGNCF